MQSAEYRDAPGERTLPDVPAVSDVADCDEVMEAAAHMVAGLIRFLVP